MCQRGEAIRRLGTRYLLLVLRDRDLIVLSRFPLRFPASGTSTQKPKNIAPLTRLCSIPHLSARPRGGRVSLVKIRLSML